MQTRIGNKTDAMALAADARRIWPARKSLAEIADAVKGILPNEAN